MVTPIYVTLKRVNKNLFAILNNILLYIKDI
jgi:hypothetical protein